MGSLVSYRVLIAALVAVVSAAGARPAPAEPPAPASAPFTVRVSCGGDIAVSPAAAAMLRDRALDLLQSSHTNSLLREWHFPLSEMQEEFRAALTSEHLRVTFAEIQSVASAGGALRVHEIIVRLGPDSQHPPFPDRFIDELFTVDDRRRIVGHALYTGQTLAALWGAVVNTTGEADRCRLPRHFPGFY